MEYFLGSLLTLVTMLIVSKLLSSSKNNFKPINLKFNQSRQHYLIRDYIPLERKRLKTQATTHFKKQHVRVIFVDSTAYWIEDGSFYMADFKDGEINQETKTKVDTMGMNKVELDRISFIVDRLTEGLTDDSGNSRN